MASRAVATVPRLRERLIHKLHRLRDVAFGCFNFEVIVSVHEVELLPSHVKALFGLTQYFEEIQAIAVIEKDLALAVTARHHVVDRTLKRESGSA
jgi:hypothetical protein